MTRSKTPVMAATCLLTYASIASAQSPSQTQSTLAEKQALSKQLWDWYGQASELHDAGKLSEAWALYQRVWRHRKTYDVATSLGGVCFQRGEYALAAHYYRIALNEMVPTASPQFVKEVEEAYGKARAEATLLRVVVAPIDGKTVPPVTIADQSGNVVLEAPYYLEPGERELEATTPGRDPVVLHVSARPGATVDWDINFEADDREQTFGEQQTVTLRHPWVVFPIGAVVTAGLGYGSWVNAARSTEAYNSAVNLNLSPGACNGVTRDVNCGRVVTLRDRARDAQTRAMWFGGGAVFAAAATGVVYWLWETEVPVTVAWDPGQGTRELRWTYEF